MTKVQPLLKLSEITPATIGQYIQVCGWVYSVRLQGAGSLCFVDVGDGSTVSPVRAVAVAVAVAKAETEEAAEDPFAYGGKTAASISTNATDATPSEYQSLTFPELCDTNRVSVGCSIQITGYVSEPPEGTTQSLEVKILQVHLIGGVADPVAYPLQKSILKKPLNLRALHHARFRAPLIQQWMQIRSQALFAVHEFFHTEGVPLCDPNIMTANDCEGAGEVFKISPQMFTKLPSEEATAAASKKKNKKNKKADPNTDEAPPSEAMKDLAVTTPTPTTTPPATQVPDVQVGLTVSSQLPLEAIAMGTGAVYTCQKSFRAEKSDTNKHLAEFLHVEFEQYFLSLTQLMDQAERFVKYVVQTTLDRCQTQYTWLDQKHAAPPESHGHAKYLRTLLEKPFVRISHSDAIQVMLQDLKDKVQVPNEKGQLVRLKFKTLPKQGEDLASEHEKYLVHKFGTFCFVTHWPSDIKSFYMKQVGDGTCESFDLLAPLVGELFGGSMREWRYDVLMEQMTKKQMDVSTLQWFVDLRKDGTAPHGGWGMGFDRLVMFLTNTASVRDIVPYPVYYGHCPY